ncbi:MAG: response regulator, partial [Burkholderiaceae bacterium]
SVDTVPAIEAHGTVETVYAADTPHMAGPVHSAQMGGMAHTAHAAESARTPTHPADANPATAAPAEAPQEWLRVPASLIERLLAFANEASILLSQAQEQALEVDRGRATLRSGTDQLQDLAGELERLVDIRGLALSDLRARQDFDALELDEYNDLHTVSRRIAESGADGRLIEQQLGSSVSALRDSLSQLERIQVDLREAALQTRMVTVDTVAPRLRRTVRQAARMAGRDVALTIEGEATAVDAQLLTALIEPLAHLLRNAVDHGIEPAELRQAHGKPAQGRIALAFHRDGPDLLIDCSDDGQGLDLPALRARALELGLLDEADAGRSDEELARLALLPGLSTRAQATQLSGRGIGLDVVEQAVREQRGAIEIDTRAGTGTRFRIRVPVRMAALPVMLIRSATHALALSVREVEQILPADRIVEDGDEPRFLVANRLLRLVRLEDVLALPDDAFATEDESAPANRAVLEVRLADGERVALLVPEPGQTRSVVVRRLASFLPPLPGIEGAAVLGDGSVAPVLDLPQLLAARQGRRAAPPLRASTQRAPVCLVVDDSVSVRRTMELFVRDLGFDADTAADGVEALEHARRRTPALVLADLEMPRMNGVELVRALRARPETRSVPVIMITSRSSDKHRQLALDAGVDVLLTKPYTEDALASQIAAVTAARAGGPDRQSGQSGQSGQGGQSGHSGQGG